jgi:spore maturation protein CgeB
MKIFFVGDWVYEMYEASFAKALEIEGHQIIPFSVKGYLNGLTGRIVSKIPRLKYYLIKLNNDIINAVIECQPEWILLWRSWYVFPESLKTLKRYGIKIATYNHDDPFAAMSGVRLPYTYRYFWYWYIKGLPYFDKNFYARKINCEEAVLYGARHAGIMRQYFVPWIHKPMGLTNKEISKYESDVTFAGHYERDGRAEIIKKLVQSGFKIKLYGGKYWTKSVLNSAYDILSPIKTVEGLEYTKALNASKICLALVSKMNRDTFTSRCAEIPACGRLMLAERTPDLLNLFKEDEEACYFSTTEELLKKVRWLLQYPEIRERISLAGYKRVWFDQHDVLSKAKQFIKELHY